MFAPGPGSVDIRGSGGLPGLGTCSGHAPYGCGSDAYANDDIFYGEACFFSKICANGEALFRLKTGEPFTCEVSPQGVRSLQRLLVEANS